MSPRRRVDDDAADYFAPTPRPPRRWGLPVVSLLATLVVAAAITGSVLMLVRHDSDRREAFREAAALGYAREFMTMYTSPDPFHANDYADRVSAQATGEFAKEFKDKHNAILLQVAQAEPMTGSVLAAGVQRWNEDGSADVLVAIKVSSKSPDGKTTIESGGRWIATTIKEGQQWKISNLIQVI